MNETDGPRGRGPRCVDTQAHVRLPLPEGDPGPLLAHLEAGRDLLGTSEVVEWVGELARWGRVTAVRAAVAIGRLHVLYAVGDAVPMAASVALAAAEAWAVTPSPEHAARAASALADARRTGALWATVPVALVGGADEVERFRQLLEVAAEDACRRHAPDEVREALEGRLRRWARQAAAPAAPLARAVESPATRTVKRPKCA